jgi:hypothetical protein
MAVAPREEAKTATTNTVDTPKRFKQLDAGCVRPLDWFARSGEASRLALAFAIFADANPKQP